MVHRAFVRDLLCPGKSYNAAFFLSTQTNQLICGKIKLYNGRIGSMPRILIVDDSIFQRKIISRMLLPEGHTVIEASGGREGLELFLKERPDLVIVDLLMPEISGTEVLLEIRRQSADMPVVVCTSDVQTATRQECMAMGASGFVNKPASRDDLIGLVNRLVH
jgi:two-component system, chemotaxis family, chemotaxis protein CheY